MKSPIVFRATFQGPKWTAIKFPGPIEVEVYQSRVGSRNESGEWRARRPATRIEFDSISPQTRAETIMSQIPAVNFAKQLTEWQAFDPLQNYRQLAKEDWGTDPQGRVYLTPAYQEKLQNEKAAASQKAISERKAKALEGM
jgi:hypothetical protein